MFDHLKQAASELARIAVQDMEETTPDMLGIDTRSCDCVWTCQDGVAITKDDVRTFNYFAGAEYVDREHVFEVGDYVFYSAECSRVAGWLGIDQEDDEC